MVPVQCTTPHHLPLCDLLTNYLLYFTIYDQDKHERWKFEKGDN